MNQETIIRQRGAIIVDALNDVVKWKYDDFNRALLAEFSADKAQQVNAIVRQHFTVEWDVTNVKQAPNLMKHLAGKYARLSKKQKLYYPQQDERPDVMLAWWPWGHGATVSIRLFIVNQEPFVSKKPLLKRIFPFLN
ncbi:hypothetical protein [Paraglaciecola sp. L1A13]|uniref:hypothetical protein n=1 Tax=Paraglaciecola sp. L1A13 TaxID=2686359 RepID=UPI00131E1A07|nr:hypothetical protein [Paraglaciecola sp. L1A13]|tara:strand:- start:8470 stop:8880 length:411 start_codon:yes stop_codon:yes gene_type:complete